MTICFEIFHENISHKTAKKKYSEIFWVETIFKKYHNFTVILLVE